MPSPASILSGNSYGKSNVRLFKLLRRRDRHEVKDLTVAVRLEGAFEALWRRFWERYLERSGDRELLEVAAPFIAFRALVMANPLWYPALDAGVRRRLFNLIVNVLDAPSFDPERANDYCK